MYSLCIFLYQPLSFAFELFVNVFVSLILCFSVSVSKFSISSTKIDGVRWFSFR